MAMERTTVRRARKDRPCNDYWCDGDMVIHVGELYNHYTASPGSYDWGVIDHWLTQDECGACAKARTGEPISRGGKP